MGCEKGELLYENPLACPGDIEGFITEGSVGTSFPRGRLRLENLRDPGDGQAANFLFWCKRDFPGDLIASWEFQPLYQPGLAMFWFCAQGRNGEDLFDPTLAPRTGEYQQYNKGDINAYHLSYFRRKHPQERAFQTCNLRKSYGFHLVAMGADPIAEVASVVEPYKIQLLKCGNHIEFSINDLTVLVWDDDGDTYGPVYTDGGKIGFRQMAPLIAEYANLTVHAISK